MENMENRTDFANEDVDSEKNETQNKLKSLKASESYSDMTESEKERVILQCKDARSDQEVDKIIDSVTPKVSEQMLEAEAVMFGPLENNGAF